MRGFLAVLQGDPESAKSALDRALLSARQTGQVRLLSHSLSLGSIASNMFGDVAGARRMLDDAHEVTAGLDDAAATVGLLQAEAYNGFFADDLDAVQSASSEGVRICRGSGDVYARGMMLMNRGLAALFAGDLNESKVRLQEALRCAYEIDDRVAQFYLLDALGCHAAVSGHAAQAARLLGAAETIRTGAGATVMPFLASSLERATEAAAATLGRGRFEAEFEAGSGLSRDAAVALGLGESARAAGARADRAAGSLLAKREEEVARLIAGGMTNKQIGARLFISERTVATHVRSIMNKLGFNTRAQIASWVASVGRSH